jgi:subtilase family serine protease
MRTYLALCATALSTVATLAFAAPAASPALVGRVDDSRVVALTADLPGAVRYATDRGALPGDTMLPHIRLELKRPPAMQAALDALVRAQQVRGSAEYHQWLKPSDLRAYGPAQADIDAVVAWLGRQGLSVRSVSPSGMSIDFAGDAAHVARAFGTALHTVVLGKETHVANLAPPSIPEALRPVVTGVTLHNFFGHPAMKPAFTVPYNGSNIYAVAPADFATIYNINPLRGSNNFFGQPITGAGFTVAMVERTNIQPKDWKRFRQAFGLAGYSGTLTIQHPGGCADPGFTPDEGEAALDAEWGTATAPDAAILLASCADGPPLGFGVENTLQALVENPTPATIFSISYQVNELAAGFSFIQGWTNLLEEGAAEGKSIFVASGDNGTSADRDTIDSNGLFVNGFADSAYNTSIGGTDFYDTALGVDGQYWRQKNGAGKSSALSYVPEIPWNNSCASSILAQFEGTTPNQLCNTNPDIGQNGVGASGSASYYYAKPDWQSIGVPGVPDDGARDQPDVSLFAANGIWNHFYVFCMSDANEGGSPCQYGTAEQVFGNAAGGTSFGSPAFAGIAALIAQAYQLEGIPGPLGNVAPRLYQIAQAQYTSGLGLNQCNSTLGNQVSLACAFYDVTAGDNAQPCFKGTLNCHTNKQSTMGIGILNATPNNGFNPAYPSTTGYDLATGLGTVNVTNLINNY